MVVVEAWGAPWERAALILGPSASRWNDSHGVGTPVFSLFWVALP